MTVSDREFLTTAQVLTLLQIGRTKLWDLVRGGAFPAFRIGQGPSTPLRYRRVDVLRWLEGNRVVHANPAADEVPRRRQAGE